jgi:para-nitrobenzyl esterase
LDKNRICVYFPSELHSERLRMVFPPLARRLPTRWLLLPTWLVFTSCASTPSPTLLPEEGPTVEVRFGNSIVLGTDVADIKTFRGIPYAKHPEGLDRWRPPQPPGDLNGFEATRQGPACPQSVPSIPGWLLSEAKYIYLSDLFDMYGLVEEEKSTDCLRLNVWTPSVDEAAAQPVIVYVHGGGLSIGSSAARPLHGASLAREGVVVVTFNYRVGTLGFLAGDGDFEGDVLAGNRGFMDTVAVLKWVQANIRSFGGDPDNITLVGQSGGGTNAWGVLASPTSEGLVHRAILMSAPVNMVPIEDQKKLTRDVLKELDVRLGDADALARLSTDDVATSIMQDTLSGGDDDTYGTMSATKLPTTGAFGTAFMPDDVLPAIEAGRLAHLDLMIGSNRHDGRGSVMGIPLPASWMMGWINDFTAGLIGPDEPARAALRERVAAAMPGASDYEIDEQIQTDAVYRMRGWQAAALHSQHSDQGRTFVYQFDWESPAAGGELGAIHSLELPFVFNTLARVPAAVGDVEAAQPLATSMSKAWASFARTGTPAAPGLPPWPEYDAQQRQVMSLDTAPVVKADPDQAIREAWAAP